MVDEARVVAADTGVDHRPVGQLEAPDVPVLDVARSRFRLSWLEIFSPA
jgi:hypothetical protein